VRKVVFFNILKKRESPSVTPIFKGRFDLRIIFYLHIYNILYTHTRPRFEIYCSLRSQVGLYVFCTFTYIIQCYVHIGNTALNAILFGAQSVLRWNEIMARGNSFDSLLLVRRTRTSHRIIYINLKSPHVSCIFSVTTCIYIYIRIIYYIEYLLCIYALCQRVSFRMT